MSTTDGDASTEASTGEVMPSLPPRDASRATEPRDVWNVEGPDDDEPDEPFEMPDIVAATDHAADERVRTAAAESAPRDAPPRDVGRRAAPRRATPTPTPVVASTEAVPTAPVPATPAPTVPTPASSTPRVAAPSPPIEPTRSAPPTTAPSPSAGPAPATAWGDHLPSTTAGVTGAPLRAPGRRPRVRRVTRVLRHIDPWSTFKVALLFSMVAYLVALTSGVLLWRVADSTGTLDNVERWFTQFGWETFELKGGEIFQNAWIIGLFAAVALTGALVLLATLFNLVSDIVGGIRLTVLEEEVVEKTASSARRYVVRRNPAGTAAEEWDVDEDVDDVVADESTAGSAARPVSSAADDWSVDDDDDDTGDEA